MNNTKAHPLSENVKVLIAKSVFGFILYEMGVIFYLAMFPRTGSLVTVLMAGGVGVLAGVAWVKPEWIVRLVFGVVMCTIIPSFIVIASMPAKSFF